MPPSAPLPLVFFLSFLAPAALQSPSLPYVHPVVGAPLLSGWVVAWLHSFRLHVGVTVHVSWALGGVLSCPVSGSCWPCVSSGVLSSSATGFSLAGPDPFHHLVPTLPCAWPIRLRCPPSLSSLPRLYLVSPSSVCSWSLGDNSSLLLRCLWFLSDGGRVISSGLLGHLFFPSGRSGT